MIIRRLTDLAFGCAAGVAVLLATPAFSQDRGGEIDPAAVSEGLKAIFSYSSTSKSTRERLNANTVTLMSGTIGGTYVQFGADLASALDDGDRMRVLPIIGRGSVQSIADILFLKGVDLGIVRADTLDYLERKGYTGNIRNQFVYITKLYNEEMHVVARSSIRSLADLNGRRVAVDLPNGGTFVTAITIFERLGVKPVYAYIEQRIAYEKLKNGELDAVIAVQGSPSKAVSQVKGEDLHFVPIPYSGPLQSDYLPSVLKAEDYPSLIPPGGRVDTIAVPAILAAYNWPAKTERYGKVEHFVQVFFDRLKDLQRSPFHPKWKEVVLSAPLKGWNRFPPAQEWLDQHSGPASDTRARFDQFLAAQTRETGQQGARTPEQDEALYQQFLKWQKGTGQAEAKR
ncbi:TAXI family TRAP transporter solute-binding subunit [Bradyrhizobium sp. CB2312]|uniref:TAXI family TRAP transporter solute-binding subunit n=1 Tax=Bradyrhizobium sp. CB2312 TaxID=3039155 RepID=UPI0024B0D433|nr:TAXI family TRAP transporter solute-binding subunit [Bradyrhizobium sp. CB2312]WFU70673.1 TAXI family TRAP transporter solute-binding subunit [Bradyrhizobium sp. CB2312]